MTDDQYQGLLAAIASSAAASHHDLSVLVAWIGGLAILLLVVIFIEVASMVRR